MANKYKINKNCIFTYMYFDNYIKYLNNNTTEKIYDIVYINDPGI